MPAMRVVAVGVLAIVAACGDGVPGPDAAIGSDATARGRVTVHVEGPTQGFEPVYFQNADSTIALATRTNDVGDASALMAPGGFVTVLDGSEIYTWTGVQPGDELTIDLTFEVFNDVFPSATVRIDPMDGATAYYLFSRCESFRDVTLAIDEVVAPFQEPCTQYTDLLLLAWSAGPIGYRYLTNVNLFSATPIDLRGAYLPIDTNVDVIGPSGRTISVRQKLSNLEYTADAGAQITGTHVLVPTDMPVLAGTTMQTIARTSDFSFPKEDATALSELASIAWGPPSALTTMDLTTPAIREVSRPELEVESYTLRWTESGSGDGGDVVWARMSLGVATWTVIAPHTDETLLRLPVLPQRDLRLRTESFFLSNFAIVAAEGGYDRLRPYLLGHWSPDGTWWPMQEPSGRVNYRSLQ